MTPLRSILFVVGGVVVGLLPVQSFSNTQSTRSQRTSSRVLMQMALPSRTSSTVAEIEAESEQLRKEIEELRKEALSRLEALSEQLGVADTSSDTLTTTAATTLTDDKDLLPAPMPITFTDTKTSTNKKTTKGIANLLDETTWKISLSIGREPGTWMPKDWGKSGQRLNLSFTADFTPSQLFDRDDFFRGGYTNAKILNVESNQITLGPSLSEGQRTFQVKNGGWQVTRGDGPMGTDLLRFFIEVDEEITHPGLDVYIPKGRIYCSCGYFPFMNDGGGKDGMKDAVKDEIKKIEEQIMQLQKKKDDIKNPFNLDGIKISSEIFKLKQDLDMMNQRLSFAMVRQPDKQLLRYSPDGDVGLTKEGGVCCEVKKGPVVEYHILGRFGVASAQKEEK
eukprot:CAMPEP_0201693550 /NCGR_PEP_ID=MMETSP0578-20130828/6121_1 /ASSEMBLY_ACC=CAM_ASM_000663 /TAXON_ID=267565 /ORGANISM="Skeletonema grethea, Strain CCMP 1804" /LENGTH=392 /DNA_ID=CAMNT_0048179109 /DNA_START=47 /DNA_END=1225 /DNA_ORIENTATION=+